MDKEALLARGRELASDRKTEDVEIGDVGTVTVRGLSRAEVKSCKGKDGQADENKMVSLGLVDPEMTVAEVAEWLDGAPAGDSVAVTEAIARLSGFDTDAQKSRLSRAQRRRRA